MAQETPVKPPEQARFLSMIEKATPLTAKEQAAWNRLLRYHDMASDMVDAAGLLLFNLYTTYTFAESKGIKLPTVDPALEVEFLDVLDSFELTKDAIRKVQDKVYGIRLTKDGRDLDIMKPKEQSFEGIIIPIIVGIVILGGAIGTSIWQYQKASALSKKYNDILEATDETLCKDRESGTCKDWEETKIKKKYQKNATIADTLKSGITTAGKGLQIGLIIALALGAFYLFGKRR